MYNWFWSLLEVLGVKVRVNGWDMAGLSPFGVPWRRATFSFWLFGRKLK